MSSGATAAEEGGYIWKFAQAHFFEKYWWTLLTGEYILRN